MIKQLLLSLLLAITSLTAFTQTTPAPTGFSEQRFCYFENPKVSDISVTGSNIKWYDAASGGNLIPSTNDIIDYKDYFASQTISGIESTSRLKVFIRKVMNPMLFPNNATFCEGGSEDLFCSVDYPSNQSEMMYFSNYEWYKDGQSIMNNSNSYNTIYTATQSGSYSVRQNSNWMNSTNGNLHTCFSESNQIQITVNPNPTATITPVGSTTISTGGSVVLNASSGTGYTYEWFKDGTSITSATTSSYTATQSGSYTVKVSNSSTTCNATSTATVVTVNTATLPTPSITPQGVTTFCEGGSVVLNSSTGTGYTYEWYKNGSIITGSTTSSYTATQSGSYTVKVSNGSSNTTSSSTTVTVNPNPTAVINAAGVSTFCQGGSVVLNASTGSGYTYEWYKNGNIINGSTTSTYTASQSGSYTVKVINGSCNATSSAAIVTVNPNPTAVITPQSNTTFCQGGSVILNASTGAGNTYEWYKNGNIINGSTTSSYTANQSGSYTVKVINGTCNATSSAAIVTVDPNPTAVITPQSTTICSNGSATVSGASSTNGTILWTHNGAGTITAGTEITLAPTYNAVAGDAGFTVTLTMTVTSNNSCGTIVAANYTINVKPLPTATISALGNTTFCQGGSVVLNASAGAGYTYEWYKNGNIINGSTTSSYTANQSGSYTVKVINGTCNATSSPTTVTVNPNPNVSLSLANFIHIKESPVTLAGSPSGGTYSGVGVVGSTFSSTNAGLGKKTITYNYTTGAGCSGSATAITTVYDTTACSTFDTLFINIAVAGLIAPNNLGTIKIWPNPANDRITIDNGNYGILSSYSVKIETVLGQEVFKSAINQQQFSVDLTTWNGKGIYLVHVLDNQNNIIETKKIVLQ